MYNQAEMDFLTTRCDRNDFNEVSGVIKIEIYDLRANRLVECARDWADKSSVCLEGGGHYWPLFSLLILMWAT